MWLEILTTIIGGSSALFLFAYLYFKKKYTFWTKRGVYQIEPTFPVGSLPEIFTRTKANMDIFLDHAKQAGDLPYYGIYFFGGPILILKDPELIRQVTVKDFDYFVDRNSAKFAKMLDGTTKSDQIWNKQISSVTGETWKNLRSTFTPIFTASKMKAMMVFLQESCQKLMDSMDKYAKNGQSFEAKDCLGRYSMDTIASCAFGVDAQSFSTSDSKFVTYAKNIFQQDFGQMMKLMTCMFVPFGKKILNTLGKSTFFKDMETEFFYEVLLESLKQRRQSKTRRNDLVDLMLDAIKGDLDQEVEQNEDDQFDIDAQLKHDASKKHEFDELSIVATAISLLVAGYDTTSTTLAYCCYQLAKNPDIQDRLRNEIENQTNDQEDLITYDQVQTMTYLDQIISEVLRLHNPASNLQRSANKDYQIPNTDLVIPEGTGVWINGVAVHMNPKYYENPKSFNPEHFSKEAKAKRHP